MATTDTITTLIESLGEIKRTNFCFSESDNRITMEKALKAVRAASLDSETERKICNAIGADANPSGYYYSSNGIEAGIDALTAVLTKLNSPAADSKEEPVEATTGFNRANLQNLVSDGSIFYVEFIKRTTGDLRKMNCRTGVKKHLKGGSRGYSTKAKNLLTVFDMTAKGYRSIPVEAIKALSVHGQIFHFEGV